MGQILKDASGIQKLSCSLVWFFYNSETFATSKCKDTCPKVCSENYWKCNGLCIPVSQPCNESCMSHLTYKCNDICILTNMPCNGNCKFENQINCKGFCLTQGKDEAWILKFGCEGKSFVMK
jgi:hypothetical protein